MTGKVAAQIIGAIHVLFCIAEMFLWKILAPRFFGAQEGSLFKEFPERFVEDTTSMAGNQGLYNLFIGVGLIAAAQGLMGEGRSVALYLLGCVVVAGVYGTWSMKVVSPLIVQSGLGAVALWLVVKQWA